MKATNFLIPVLTIVTSACRSNPATQNQKHDLAVANHNIDVSVGQGYDPVSGSYAERCIEAGPLKTQNELFQDLGQAYRIIEITSLNELEEQLRVSPSESLNGGQDNKNQRFEFAKSVGKNHKNRYLMIHIKAENSMEIAESFTFSSSTQKLLLDASVSNEDFKTKCGTEFVYGRRTGGELFAIFEFEFSTYDEAEAFSSAVNKIGTQWKDVVQAESEILAFADFRHSNIYTLKIGGTERPVNVSSVSGLISDIGDISFDLKKKSEVLEWFTKQYDGVEPFDLRRPDFSKSSKQKYILKNIVQSRNRAIELINSTKYTIYLSSKKNFDSPLMLTLNLERLQKYVHELDELATRCLANANIECVIPELDLDITWAVEKE